MVKKLFEEKIDYRVCLLDRHSILETANQVQGLAPFFVPLIPVSRRHLRFHRQWHPDVRRSAYCCAVELRPRDANDRKGGLIDPDCFSDRVCSATEILLPPFMAEHCNRMCANGLIIGI